jgi:hypothetical protein
MAESFVCYFTFRKLKKAILKNTDVVSLSGRTNH